MKRIKIATVFSGIGAAEQALKQAKVNYEIVFACDNGERYIDIDEAMVEKVSKEFNISIKDAVKKIYKDNSKKENLVKKSYFANYDIDEERWYEDIRFLDGTPYKGKVDIIVGGSPCQSFSTYGHKMGLEDTRGTLFYDYARLIDEVQPKAFIFENVTGLLTHDNGKTWNVIREVFESLNYNIKFEVLNAMDFNLPQLRRRLFVVAVRNDLGVGEYVYPAPVPLTHKSTDYLENYVENKYYLGEKGFKFVTDPIRSGRRARSNQDIIGCQTANQQFNWVGDFRVERPEERHLNDPKIYKGLYNGEISVARKMKPIELLRLMGFKNFNIVVEDKVMWRQTGNSIAVPVIKAVLKNLINLLDKKGDDC